MPIARSTTTGIATGVVLLAAFVGFGVGLPQVVGAPATSTATPPELPGQLGDYTAVSALTAEDAGATTDADVQSVEDFVKAAGEQDSAAEKNLTEQYGDARVKVYVDAEGMANVATTGGYGQFAATIVPGSDTGLVISGGPYETTSYELKTVGGHRCSVTQQTSSDGSEPTDLNYQVECRAAVDGLVYDIYSVSIAPDDVAALLDDLIALDRT